MAVRPSALQACLWEIESSFGETTQSFANRLQHTNLLDVTGITHEKVPIAPVVQRQNDGVHDMRGIMGGSFTLELDLTGRGSSSAAGVTLSSLATLLGYCVGNAARAATSGTTAAGGGSATSTPVAAAAADFSAGSLCRIGAQNDGRGGGQFAAISGDASDTLTHLTAIGGAANASDVVYAPDMVYPNEDPDQTSIQSLRFALATANQSFYAHGCYCTGIEFTGLNTGERPKVRLTFAVAWFENASPTFPSSTAVGNSGSPVPVAAGSFFYNTVGTATRQTAVIRGFNLSIDLQVHPLIGPGGLSQYQSVVGCVRSRCQASFDFLVDGDDTGFDTWWNTDEGSITFRHFLYTLSVKDSAALAFYFPRVKPVGARPMQQDNGGVNARRVMCQAVTGATTTTQLTASNWRLAMA